MNQFNITIYTLSPLSLGSGQADVNVDSEIVHDKYGLPYFPGRRLRGLLYESAEEVAEMAAKCGNAFLTLKTVNELFHHTDTNTCLIVPNLYIPDYETVIQELQYLEQQYSSIIRPDAVLDVFSSLRFQTAIDEKTGVAKEHSLRNIRVLNKNIYFTGTLTLIHGTQVHQQALALAVQNLHRAGANRNRGFGQIQCTIEHQQELLQQALKEGGNL